MSTLEITLSEPVTRGEGEENILKVTIRKPKSGALRGVNLAELLNLNTDAIMKVTPRVSDPILHELDLQNMDPADLLQIGSVIASFLLPREVQNSLKE